MRSSKFTSCLPPTTQIKLEVWLEVYFWRQWLRRKYVFVTVRPWFHSHNSGYYSIMTDNSGFKDHIVKPNRYLELLSWIVFPTFKIAYLHEVFGPSIQCQSAIWIDVEAFSEIFLRRLWIEVQWVGISS